MRWIEFSSKMKLVVYLHLLLLSLALKYAIQYTLRKSKNTFANRH